MRISDWSSDVCSSDLPGVGPEHAFLKDTGRAEYVGVTDDEALAAFHLLAKTEGILAALESSHAIAQAIKLARDMPKDAIVLCTLSGRGDKDVHTIAAREGLDLSGKGAFATDQSQSTRKQQRRGVILDTPVNVGILTGHRSLIQ